MNGRSQERSYTNGDSKENQQPDEDATASDYTQDQADAVKVSWRKTPWLWRHMLLYVTHVLIVSKFTHVTYSRHF